MSCTTIIIGKKASYDGSTIIARNEDSCAGCFDPKKMVLVKPEDQPVHYQSVISKEKIELPTDPMAYSSVPEAVDWHGIWAASGINEANVAMTATETITGNERFLAVDPLTEEKVGGFGEEDLVTIVLPYIKSARDGVKRLGAILEKHGTYEQNGIAFADGDEVWYLETIGGHNWMARRLADDSYAVLANQLSIDSLNFDDCYGKQEEFMCSSQLKALVEENRLDLSLDGKFNPRQAFGSITDTDTVYNTPRVWSVQKKLNPHSKLWDDPAIDNPRSFNLAWSMVPERKLTIEDVKRALSDHYQGSPYDPYTNNKTPFRPIGVNRTNHIAVLQIRPYLPEEYRSIHWISFGCNIYNALLPMYPLVDSFPAYLECTGSEPSTESFYWTNRLISALADPVYYKSLSAVENYRESVTSQALGLILSCDKAAKSYKGNIKELLGETNEKIAAMAKTETSTLLKKVLDLASNSMKSAFYLSDN